MNQAVVALRVLIFAAATLALVPVLGAETAEPRFVFPQIDGLIETDGSGAYQKLLALAAERAGLNYTFETFPKARALSLFLSGIYDGIFSYTQTARDKFGKDRILASYPFGAYRGFVFRKKGDQPVTDFSQLQGQKVGGVIGFEGTYGAVIQAGASLDLAVNDESNIEKLERGRVFAVLCFLPDLFPRLDQLSYSPSRPFFESYDRLTLHASPENRDFLLRLSTELEKMHADGTVRRLVGPAYLRVSGSFRVDG